MSLLKDFYEAKMKLVHFSLFKEFPQKYLWKLAEQCEKIFYRKNAVIYSYNDVCKFAYFILKGQVQITKKKDNYRNDVKSEYINFKKYRTGMVIKSYHDTSQQNSKILTNLNYFGLAECIKQQNILGIRKQQAKCRSNSILLKIQIKDIINAFKNEKHNIQTQINLSQDEFKDQPSNYDNNLSSLHLNIQMTKLKPENKLKNIKSNDLIYDRKTRLLELRNSFQRCQRTKINKFNIKNRNKFNLNVANQQNESNTTHLIHDSPENVHSKNINLLTKIQSKQFIRKQKVL